MYLPLNLEKILETLIQHNPNIDIPNLDNITPLEIATQKGHLEMVCELEKHTNYLPWMQ